MAEDRPPPPDHHHEASVPKYITPVNDQPKDAEEELDVSVEQLKYDIRTVVSSSPTSVNRKDCQGAGDAVGGASGCPGPSARAELQPYIKQTFRSRLSGENLSDLLRLDGNRREADSAASKASASKDVQKADVMT